MHQILNCSSANRIFCFEGLNSTVKTIDRVKESLNSDLSIRGIILTMYDKRNKLSSQVEKEARDYFKEKVYNTVIPRNVRLSEAPIAWNTSFNI